MPDNFNPQEWITTTEAAKLTGYASSSFRHLILRNKIYAEKRGRDWFLRRDDVVAYAEKMKALGKAKYNPR